ncbi:hypothetical protein BGW38_005906, partial [Lunasporangiospora selenospora]
SILKEIKINGHHIRKWKITIQGVNANGDDEALPYVDYVEYILHQTFDHPVRKVTEYPFVLQEKGWGEFDMKIMLYFTDKSVSPTVLDHDLNFRQTHYTVSHNLTFKSDVKPGFLKLLTSRPASISEGDTSYDSTAGDGLTHKRRRDAVFLKEKSKRIRDYRSSDDESHADSSAGAGSGDEWGDKVDLHQLAMKFQMLRTDDLVELVNLVKANQTSEMYIKEDGEAGEYQIDLNTLGSGLLATLWQFCVRKLDS